MRAACSVCAVCSVQAGASVPFQWHSLLYGVGLGVGCVWAARCQNAQGTSNGLWRAGLPCAVPCTLPCTVAALALTCVWPWSPVLALPPLAGRVLLSGTWLEPRSLLWLNLHSLPFRQVPCGKNLHGGAGEELTVELSALFTHTHAAHECEQCAAVPQWANGGWAGARRAHAHTNKHADTDVHTQTNRQTQTCTHQQTDRHRRACAFVGLEESSFINGDYS